MNIGYLLSAGWVVRLKAKPGQSETNAFILKRLTYCVGLHLNFFFEQHIFHILNQ